MANVDDRVRFHCLHHYIRDTILPNNTVAIHNLFMGSFPRYLVDYCAAVYIVE